MKANLLLDRRLVISETAFVELVLWELPAPSRASIHNFKYRLALVDTGRCVLRFDNEAGKGDHIHIDDKETAYAFIGVDRLMSDFSDAVKRWMNEHNNS